jgi:hypothetical protein
VRRFIILLFAGVVLWTTPADAIETTTFGIDVVEAADDQRLHIPVRAGERSTAEVRVWNKQDTPLSLELSVAAARVDANGQASLGGDDEPVEWVSLEPATVELGPRAERKIEVRVDAPRRLDGKTKVVAVLAQPSTDPGSDPPAVLQRLAITTFLEPDEDSLIASLGPFPWIAGGVLLVVVIWLARRTSGRTDDAPKEA